LDKTPSYFNAPTPLPTSQSARFPTCRCSDRGAKTPNSPRGTISTVDRIRQWYHYNSDVRCPYLEVLVGLPTEVRLQDRGASYPSLQEIHVDVLVAYLWWFDYVPNDPVGEYLPLNGRNQSPDALRDLTTKIDSVVFGFLDGLTEPDLARGLVCHFPSDTGLTLEKFLLEDVLWHTVEEELPHRGELNALRWQSDIEPPIPGRDD